jgi:hypothetical protein
VKNAQVIAKRLLVARIAVEASDADGIGRIATSVLLIDTIRYVESFVVLGGVIVICD